MSSRRILHYVFKIGNRKDTIKFYTEVLGMKVLRHEEFEEGCKATCNGPYDGKWSKTMIGYGPEDDHFVAELTYNYGIKSYKLGNGFLGITINSKSAVRNAETLNYPLKEENDLKLVEAPGGYKYYLIDQDSSSRTVPVSKVSLASSNLQTTIDYWHGLLGMKVYEKSDSSVSLGYSNEQCRLEFRKLNAPVDHSESSGRVAFACPTGELAGIEEAIQKAGCKILTPLVSLDTPGKATVHVVILADPDGHEICFVGDEGFRELSQVDPKGEDLLKEAMSKDKSDEWFAKKGSKTAA